MDLFIKTAISCLKYFCNKFQRLKIKPSRWTQFTKTKDKPYKESLQQDDLILQLLSPRKRTRSFSMTFQFIC